MSVVLRTDSCAVQVNPPYYVKLVELVPHPETAALVMDTAQTLMAKVKLDKVEEGSILCFLLITFLVLGRAGSCLSEERD